MLFFLLWNSCVVERGFLRLPFFKHSNFHRFVFVPFFQKDVWLICPGGGRLVWMVHKTEICVQLTCWVIQRQVRSTSKADCLIKLPSMKFIQHLDKTSPIAVAETKAPCLQWCPLSVSVPDRKKVCMEFFSLGSSRSPGKVICSLDQVLVS